MISRTWSHEVIGTNPGRMIVIIETIALVMASGPDIHGCGLKLPRYVVAGGDKPRIYKVDGSETGLDEVRAVYPAIDGLTT